MASKKVTRNRRYTSKHLPSIYALRQTDDKFQGTLAADLSDNTLDFLSSCVGELLSEPKNFKLAEHEIKQLATVLKPDRKTWSKISCCKQSNKNKRKLLRNQTGRGLPLILASIVPTLIELVVGAFKKKKKN